MDPKRLESLAGEVVLKHIKAKALKNDPRLHVAKLAIGKKLVNEHAVLEDLQAKSEIYRPLAFNISFPSNSERDEEIIDFLSKGDAKLQRSNSNHSDTEIIFTRVLADKLFTTLNSHIFSDESKREILAKTIDFHNKMIDLNFDKPATEAESFLEVASVMREVKSATKRINQIEDDVINARLSNKLTSFDVSGLRYAAGNVLAIAGSAKRDETTLDKIEKSLVNVIKMRALFRNEDK